MVVTGGISEVCVGECLGALVGEVAAEFQVLKLLQVAMVCILCLNLFHWLGLRDKAKAWHICLL